MMETMNRSCLEDGSWSDVNYSAACGDGVDKILVIRREQTNTDQDSLVTQLTDQLLLNLFKNCFSKPFVSNNTQGGCPLVFDLLASCWEPTPPGVTANLSCPTYVIGFDRTRYAFRKCEENGTWASSNYTTCIDMDDFKFRQFVNRLYIIGYCVSIFALVISLIVFLAFRSLKCTRISIHVQLFFSFAINNLLWVIWYVHVVEDLEVIHKNGLFCRALHILVQYTTLATYAWMFCEALHLHLALMVVFFRSIVVWRYFLALGWCAPAFITIIYCITRSSKIEDIKRCWMFESDSTWILTIPVLATLIASTIFLANVLRVLVGKVSLPAPALRKGVRAAFILVPLFGLQHYLLPYRPVPGRPGEHFYQVFSAIVVAPQGLCISFLFCFLNVDVHAAIRTWLNRWFPDLGTHSEGLTGAAAIGAPHATTRDTIL